MLCIAVVVHGLLRLFVYLLFSCLSLLIRGIVCIAVVNSIFNEKLWIRRLGTAELLLVYITVIKL